MSPGMDEDARINFVTVDEVGEEEEEQQQPTPEEEEPKEEEAVCTRRGRAKRRARQTPGKSGKCSHGCNPSTMRIGIWRCKNAVCLSEANHQLWSHFFFILSLHHLVRKSTRGRRGAKPGEEVEEEQEKKEETSPEKTLTPSLEEAPPPPTPAPALEPVDSESKPASLPNESQTAATSSKESNKDNASFGQENKGSPQDVKEEGTTISSAKLEMLVATKEDKADVKDFNKGIASFLCVFSILHFK